MMWRVVLHHICILILVTVHPFVRTLTPVVLPQPPPFAQQMETVDEVNRILMTHYRHASMASHPIIPIT